MALSVFDLFSIGIGPSSSHTVGPMRAAAMFLDSLGDLTQVERVECRLYGSLGATGVGHATDKAVMIGLMGEQPESVDPQRVTPLVHKVEEELALNLGGVKVIDFPPQRDIIFLGREELPGHPNGMTLEAWNSSGESLAHTTYYSVGGGFVVEGDVTPDEPVIADEHPVPYPFHTAAELLEICEQEKLSIAQVVMANELTCRREDEVRAGLLEIWQVMKDCVTNGITSDEGILPGVLRVPRRAPALAASLKERDDADDPLRGLDWVTLYALAVNEENAAGGRIVTAPTNGAAGIIPAVLHYYMSFCSGNEEGVIEFLLTAAAIGMVVKNNASLSGAEVGCQGEVGSASSMAAGGVTAVLGGSPRQVENAAEIAMEHNLGLTCDPIAGLVQIPCIERNAVASVKALTAARTALRGNGEHLVSLDDVVRTMKETGRDMQVKYKETALGGLAVHAGIPVSIVEC
ncbi:L-serine ammonia-lyase [Arcanobacterium canis]